MPLLPADLRIEQVPITHPDALRLIDEVQAEYRVRYGGPDRTPLEPAYFEPPAGAFYVGFRDDVAGGDGRLALPPRRVTARLRPDGRGEADVRRARGPARADSPG